MTPTTLNPIVNPTWTPTVTPKTLIPTAAPTVTPKALFRDACFKRDRDLGSVNSANIARLLVQAVHFFYLYFRVASETSVSPVSPVSPAPPVSPVSPVLPVPPPPLEVAVPSGAAGHVSAGILAQQMGLPITLLGATNANDALCRLLGAGRLVRGGSVTHTLSPSMDIQMPYNAWRLLYVASGGDGAQAPFTNPSTSPANTPIPPPPPLGMFSATPLVLYVTSFSILNAKAHTRATSARALTLNLTSLSPPPP